MIQTSKKFGSSVRRKPIEKMGELKHGPPGRNQLQKQWQQLPQPLKDECCQSVPRQLEGKPVILQEGAYKTVDAFLKHTGSEKSNTRVLFRKYATGASAVQAEA